VVAFAEQVQVEVGELRREVIGVPLAGLGAVPIAYVQAVGVQRATEGHAALEEARGVDALQDRRRRAVVPADLDPLGVGLEHAHHAEWRRVVLAREFVVPEQRARLRVTRVQQRVDVGGGQGGLGGHDGSLAPG
jgi:hypothetical protein